MERLNFLITYVIPISALLISIFSIWYKIYLVRKEKREKYLKLCVLYHRDVITELLDKIKKTKKPKNGNIRKIFSPLFDDLKYYIHDMKFFDLKYNTKIYELIFDEILSCETAIYAEMGNLEKSINKIKKIILTSH